MMEQDLPDEYDWFAEQIAGHHPSVIKNGKREIGLLKKQGSDKILKPKQDASRGKCEVSIYKLLSERLRKTASGEEENIIQGDRWSWPSAREEDIRGLAKLTPAFFGIKSLTVDGKEHEFLILQDVTAPFQHPAILDIKMGRVTFDPQASAAKREKESAKYPPQKTLGFRLLGYRMHSKGHDVVFKDKDWGKRHDETNIHEGLLEFFSGRGKDASLISSILCRLSTVWKWFNSQRTFHFFASSLLFIYETDASLQANAQLVMIDFSHVFPANGEPDFNYLHGLENLIRSMNKLQEEFSRHDDQ